MIEAHDGEKPALAILLSDNLAFRIQKPWYQDATIANQEVLR
jgi:hypothetical protein